MKTRQTIGCHLHTHSDVSHDGYGNMLQRALAAKSLGHTSLALTDHGVMGGLLKHKRACEEVGIKPILGCEIYYQHSLEVEKKEKRYHLTVLCESSIGYNNLCEMITEANLEENKYGAFPTVGLGNLTRHSEGLLVLSGCVSSYLSYMVNDQKDELNARVYLTEMRAIFGDRFYLEVQPFEAPGQEVLNLFCTEMGKYLQIPVVMTSDAHYPEQDDLELLVVAQKMRKGDRASGTMMQTYQERWLRTDNDMLTNWQNFMGSDGTVYWQESYRIAYRCNVTIDATPKMPVLPWIQGSYISMLARKVQDGMKERGVTTQAHKERATYELNSIHAKHFASYFLLIDDIITWAKSQGIPIWTRGSAGGSLVAYALYFNDIDPLEHNTSFDRFLSPDRVELPDVDLDTSSKHRDRVIAYIASRFPGQAYQVSTYGKWKTDSLVNGLAKVLIIVDQDVRSLKRAIREVAFEETGINQTLLGRNLTIQNLEMKYPGLTRLFMGLFESMSFMGTNAAGIVIAAGDISKHAAIIRYKDKYQICYDKDDLDDVGLVKFDVLGVSGCDAIDEACKLAGVTFPTTLEELLTPQVVSAFASGDTVGINQFERMHVRTLFRQLGKGMQAAYQTGDTSEVFRMIAAVNAMIRPPCKAEGTDKQYIDAVRGKPQPTGVWSQFADDTRGTYLYQEQVVSICLYAGLDWGDIGKILKFLKHKDASKPLPVGIAGSFIIGMVAKGHSAEEAKSAWKNMLVYLFNRAHAVSYAFMAVVEMWLREHHPLAWYTSLLNNESDGVKQNLYLADAAQHGVKILNPHVRGGGHFRQVVIDDKNQFLQVGLLVLDGIGPKVASMIDYELAKSGPFAGKDDFVTRMAQTVEVEGKKKRLYPGIGESTIATLEHYGALEFDATRYQGRVKQYNKVLLQTPILIVK